MSRLAFRFIRSRPQYQYLVTFPGEYLKNSRIPYLFSGGNGRLCCDRREMRQEKPASHEAADQREKRNTTTVQEAGGERKGRVFHPICEIPSPFSPSVRSPPASCTVVVFLFSRWSAALWLAGFSCLISLRSQQSLPLPPDNKLGIRLQNACP